MQAGVHSRADDSLLHAGIVVPKAPFASVRVGERNLAGKEVWVR